MKLTRFVLLAVAVLLPAAAQAQIDARMLRTPAVSATQIAFVYGGDIWIMPKAGGTASRLTSARGEESFPKFSPDGSLVAFTGDYDGNQDVYVIPATGGEPKRITYHPAADRVAAWYPDGKSLLIASSRSSETGRYNKLFKISKDGGLPEPLPMPYGEFASIADDGHTIAYMPEAVDARTWKRYRGGWAPDVWTFDLTTGAAKNITHDEASDAQPMWHGNTLYYLSDRDAKMRGNIWAWDKTKNTFREVTHFTDFDVKYPSNGPNDIVFQAGSRMYLLDLANEQMHEVNVKLVTDRAMVRPHAQDVFTEIASGALSSTGKRALFEAHGDVFTVPAENGITMDLTNTSNAAERTPQWSPDGKSIAYWSDKTGEYELTIRNADGSGEERTVTKLGPGFRYTPFWSPNSKKIAFIDQAMRIQYVDVETGVVKQIDKALEWLHGPCSAFRVSWSGDSRWIAYFHDLINQNDAIFIYDTKTGEKRQVTSGYFDDNYPVFDPDGKYLFYLSQRSFNPSYSDFDNTWIYANSTRIISVPLRNDVPSLIAPKNDQEAGAMLAAKPDSTKPPEPPGAGGAGGAGGAAGAAGAAPPAPGNGRGNAAPREVTIDFDNFERRAEALPPAPGNYGVLNAVSGGVLYVRGNRTGAAPGTPTPIVQWNFTDRDEKVIVDNSAGYTLSADGKKMMVRQGQNLFIIDVRPAQRLDKPLQLTGMTMTVDPMQEWKQIFNDAWRVERDYFYDPGMHGVNWNEMRTRYGALVNDAVSRWDVNFILGELIGELNSSHTYVQGGQVENGPNRGVGLLGADFALENGAYRIRKIVDGGSWDSEVRSPLHQAGANINEGDYILAVNGRPIDITKEPAAALDGLANVTVALTVNSTPSMTGSRVVLVRTLTAGAEARLRNLAWIEANRQRVEKATNGRLGYVYVPSTGVDGQTELVRQYRAQIDKEGLIIDERFNSGGQIPDRFVELLNRPRTNYWKIRDGVDWPWPQQTQDGPKAMLINGWSGSGGDAFPYYFKQAGLGPLIGMRTWGGLIGISGTPNFVDGGSVTAPSFGIYSKTGQWIIESHGVDPDIEVVDDPALMAKGGDPQLERAIKEVMAAVEKAPKKAAAPAYPKRVPPQ